MRVLAYYLPQFHPFAENDANWGKGFTEWRNAVKARPLFQGHQQPNIPADLGFYDLRLLQAVRDQYELAQQNGVHGFLPYFYYFGGRQLMHQPINHMMHLKVPFALFWANEPWTRRWDVARYMQAESYIRVNGRPVFAVYRPTHHPALRKLLPALKRALAKKLGVEPYFIGVHAFRPYAPGDYALDAMMEFPPHNAGSETGRGLPVINGEVGAGQDYTGCIYAYEGMARSFMMKSYTDKTFRCVCPGWDNTPRRGLTGHAFANETPEEFQRWVRFAAEATRREHAGDEQLMMVNAWNEWAEGAMLEPDLARGHARLQALKAGLA
jgi:lipopolysaccharide biosynthesis protein